MLNIYKYLILIKSLIKKGDQMILPILIHIQNQIV